MKELDLEDIIAKEYHVLAGRIGSGKTEIAVNLAIRVSQRGTDTMLFDLDIVKPYVKIRDFKDKLEKYSFEIVSPPELTKTLDIPILPHYIVSYLKNKNSQKILDIGGDPYGAGSIAQFRKIIKSREYDFFFVVNTKRPETSTPDEIIATLREIEQAARINVTSLVLNPNLRWETTKETIREAYEIASDVSERTGLPISFICVDEKRPELLDGINIPALPLKLFVNPLPRLKNMGPPEA